MMSTHHLAEIDEVEAFGATSDAPDFLAVVDTIIATADLTDARDTDKDLLNRAIVAVTIALADHDLYGKPGEAFLDGFAATPIAAGIWTALRNGRDALNMAVAA